MFLILFRVRKYQVMSSNGKHHSKIEDNSDTEQCECKMDEIDVDAEDMNKVDKKDTANAKDSDHPAETTTYSIEDSTNKNKSTSNGFETPDGIGADVNLNELTDIDFDTVDQEQEEHEKKDVSSNKAVKILPKDKIDTLSKERPKKMSESVNNIITRVEKKKQNPCEYIVELKFPIHLCYNNMVQSGINVDGLITGQPGCNIRPVRENATSMVPQTVQITNEEMNLYSMLSVSKNSNHETSPYNPDRLEPERIRYVVKYFSNFYSTNNEIKDCLYGLCTLRRLDHVCKTLAIGKKYMFLFRVNNNFTKYISFTVRCKEKRSIAILSGLIQKTYNVMTVDGCNIVFHLYGKRSNGSIHVSDTAFNQIEFNFASYTKITGDMIMVYTTADKTLSYKLNEIYVMLY